MTTKYQIKITTRFKKSYKKIIQQPGYHQNDFQKVIEMLANDIVLPEQYRNHLLEPKSNRSMGMSYQT
ncbi:MAG: type II toxin-antitoxin system mRNA interferase toxin, RelE/StbE family [Clostridia bacterium]|nr:type II toxin-antitoxin system mRNA interferase toxin, RelE/StbE family [Clostridia bacterium]